MKKLIPSFQIQILILFILLLIFSMFFSRNFFLTSLNNYTRAEEENLLEKSLVKTYNDFKIYLPDSLQNKFGEDITNSIKMIKTNQLHKDFFQEEFSVYSVYVVVFLLIIGLIVFLISFAVISRPLKRLQKANRALGQGRFDVRVCENSWSPLNPLLVSFNTMAAEIEENRRLLLEAEKKLIWREIARAMAHEIKNPLTPIKLSLERLEIKYEQKTENLDAIFDSTMKIINEEVDNLQKLVERFRGFATLPQPEKEKYDLLEQLQKVIEPYQNQRNINIQNKLEKIVIVADKLQMKQVFVNLIQNAFHATKEEEKIELMILRQPDCYEIEIKDFGKGISAENLNQVFEPYFTTKRKGTGLGLAVVRQIIENHGGSITIVSREKVGTTVKVILPDPVAENENNLGK